MGIGAGVKRDDIIIPVHPQISEWDNLILVTEEGHFKVFGCLCFSDLDQELSVNVRNCGNIGFLHGNEAKTRGVPVSASTTFPLNVRVVCWTFFFLSLAAPA